MAQKLAPAEKNSTDISAGSATFCISALVFTQAQALSEEDEGMWMGAWEASIRGDHFNLFGQKIQIFC